MIKIIKKGAYIGALAVLFSGVLSCEKDFTDIGTNIISNTKFSTDNLIVDITVENSPVEKVASDNISVEPVEYLLGVFASSEYEKIEASIVSQVAITAGLELINADTITKYETATSRIVTTIDTAFIKLPYQATLEPNSTTDYTLDGIIGNESEAFTLNVYQTNTFLSRLNPVEPSKLNTYNSLDIFEKIGNPLNSELDYPFIPNDNASIIINRRTSTNILISRDTIIYSSSDVPFPFVSIALNEDKFKEIFLDKYGSSDFESIAAFNNYFRGIILEATGSKGSLIPFNFNVTTPALSPSIEVFYTNTVLETATNDTIKTFRKNDSFLLSGIRAATYKMEDKIYPVNNEVIVQGTAGSEAKVTLFDATKLEELRAQNLLINDASITFYINQSSDTTALPNRLYLYKDGESINQSRILSQVKDTYSETTFGGLLERDSGGKAEKYTFKITDYISDLLSGETNYNPPLKLKVFNSTDIATVDTLFRPYSWNPSAITLFNHATENGAKKAELKIFYSQKKD